jgi:hypothetical protein
LYSPGDCLIIETNQYEDGTEKAHLFVVIFEANKKTDKTLIIPFCKIIPGRYYDPTVVFPAGVHDFITQPTYVDYYSGRIETVATIDELIRLRRARIRKPPLDAALLKRVCEGIRKSKDTPIDISDFYLYFELHKSN